MKKIIALLIIVSAITIDLSAQDVKPESKQFMQINTVESVVSGGFGRSKMIITNPDGTQKEADLENLFSLTGINFKNIKENEDKIVKTLKFYTDDGWKLDHVTSLTLSQNDNGAGGIFMTRYLLSKPLEKKGF
ncbi:MAG: hypothetical protein E6H09_15980 [Bacteroidetes bacterium]|jgi:hypothetical protein|nr:MAG: hypothetical protein E6H09_15980 [Bacteroidota bacterium]